MGGALTDSGLVFQSSGQVETGGEAAEPAPRSGILGHHCGSCARASRGLPRWLPGTGPAHGRSYAGFVQVCPLSIRRARIVVNAGTTELLSGQPNIAEEGVTKE